jgi:arginine transport system substrate-binding protein
LLSDGVGATEATYPPFEYQDEKGNIKGFDIDIANALCKQMKAECTFTNQAFSSLIPSLAIGKFDAIIAALGITAERQKEVSFTDSYYTPSASFVAPLSKHYQLKNLTGKTVGVQQGSTFEKYLSEKYGKQLTPKTYASIQEAFLDLTAGRVDVVIADTTIAQIWLKNNKNYTIVGKPITDIEYFGIGYGIAVSKNNPTLLNDLNAALKAIKANGEYDKVIKEYFGH